MVLFASVFSRARETAEISKKIFVDSLQNGMFLCGVFLATLFLIPSFFSESIELNLTVKLVERYFGDFEGLSNNHYEDVWRDDQVSQFSDSF